MGETEYATTLASEGEEVRTVEHLLSALHAAGITNLLIKVRGEIPVLDGSAAWAPGAALAPAVGEAAT